MELGEEFLLIKYTLHLKKDNDSNAGQDGSCETDWTATRSNSSVASSKPQTKDMSDLQGSVARDKPKPAVKVEAVSATQQQRVSKQQVTSKSSKSINQSPYSKSVTQSSDFFN
ncbi:unnamed protein product [Anisakis simplex]|uniref:Uncharacterized protein n=1 Tax=Anisakis simplex TaxID=6269 RepID=A0A0M3J3D7_ANISI|nr:unnamed protein product [Anisakis simplex]